MNCQVPYKYGIVSTRGDVTAERQTHRTAGSRHLGEVLGRLTEVPIIEDSEDPYYPVNISVEPEQNVVVTEVAM